MTDDTASIFSAQLCGAIDNLTEAVREVAAQLYPLAALVATTKALDEHLTALIETTRSLRTLVTLADDVHTIAQRR